MNHGQFDLLAGLLSFSALGIMFKIADVKKCRPSAINALMYGWSVLIALALTTLQSSSVGAPASVFFIALPFGMAASVAILALQAGIHYGNISTSWLAINLSAVIPTLGSILIYDEPVSAVKVIALLLIPVSMLLLWKDKRDAELPGAGDQEAQPGLMPDSKEAR